MVYALCGRASAVPSRDVRIKIAEAIIRRRQGEVDRFTGDGVILHVSDWRATDECYCIWCCDDVKRASDKKTFFKHKHNSKCLGTDKFLGIMNPPDRGYAEAGREPEEKKKTPARMHRGPA